jgi:hypothetical protein
MNLFFLEEKIVIALFRAGHIVNMKTQIQF